MVLIDEVGVVIPSGADVSAVAATLERLGFAHAAVDGDSPTATILALGATRSLLVHGTVPAALASTLPLNAAQRVRERIDDDVVDVTTADLENPATLREKLSTAVRFVGDRRCTPTVRLPADNHRRALLALALDVLTDRGRSPDTCSLAVGQVVDLGTRTVTAEGILAFAEQWDPLDLHLDSELAERTALGTLCASGIQTQAVMQEMTARGLLRHLPIVAGRGILGMRLRRPVVPGMTLHGTVEVIAIEPHHSGQTLITITSRLHDRGEPVLEQTGQLVAAPIREAENLS